MSLEQFRTRLLEQETCQAVLEREVKKDLAVSDDAARKFYGDNPAQFEKKEQVRASHILISTMDPATKTKVSPEVKKQKEKLAKEIKAKIDGGEDFAKLVKEYSEDPGSKSTGGEYTFGKGEMVPEFEAAAFSLKTNQVSDLVETQFGYHIIKLLEKIPAGKMDYAKVAPKLKEYLENQQLQRALPPYFERLKKENEVEIIGAKAKS
jgi:parvulin-like peptidyl-prolyl isomerase